MIEGKYEIKRNKLKILVLLLLIFLVFIIIICASFKFGKIDIASPTGNIDIFDINIYYNSNDDEEIFINDESNYYEKNYNKNVQGSEKNIVISDNDIANANDNINDDIEEDGDNISGSFGVMDKDIQWQNSAELRIFENYAFQMRNIIAPGSSNTYNFIIKNNNNFPIIYTFSTTEDNKYKVNLKYRLKQNGKYVIGDNRTWVSYDKLLVSNAILSSKSKCLYSLEWKWIDSDYDNMPGISKDAVYKLMIRLNASQYMQ